MLRISNRRHLPAHNPRARPTGHARHPLHAIDIRRLRVRFPPTHVLAC